MILTRSPYYKSVPWNRPSDGATADSYKLELFIWTGNKTTDVPLSATYSIVKENIEVSTGTDKVDVARLINDYIQNTVITGSLTGLKTTNSCVWVKHQIKYTVGANITNELVVTDFATQGYGYGYEGENHQAPNNMLTDVLEVDVYEDGYLMLPIVRSNNLLRVTSFPKNIFFQEATITASTESTQNVSVFNIDMTEYISGEEYININYDGVDFTAYIRDECLYAPIDVQFINRYGASQTITFFKERRDSMSAKGSTYESSSAQPSTGKHQFVDFNVNGKTSFEANTGYLSEDANELIKQLILSEEVWIGGIPVNTKTKNVEYKTQVNDRLVNYTMQFEYSYNEINTI